MATIQPQADGSLLASLNITAAGAHELHVAHVPVFGNPVAFAKLRVVVQPATADLSRSVIARLAPTYAAGSAASFRVMPQDAFGNNITGPAALLAVQNSLQLVLSTGAGGAVGPQVADVPFYAVLSGGGDRVEVKFEPRWPGALQVQAATARDGKAATGKPLPSLL